MKILFLTNAYSPVVGGVERVAAELARGLLDRGEVVEVVTARNPWRLKAKEQIDGVLVRRLPFYVYRDSWLSAAAMGLGLPIAVAYLYRLVQQSMPCVVHIHFIYHQAVCVELMGRSLRRMCVPLVLTLHGGDAPNIPRSYRVSHRSESRILDWAARRLLQRADAVTAVSEGRRNELLASGVAMRCGVQVIYNGVDTRRFAPLDVGATRPVVLGVGRLAYEKGFDILIDAFTLIAREYPIWELNIAGAGELGPALKELVVRRGIANRVRFLGMLSTADVARSLQEAGVVAAPSRWEGFPLVALEAMACGKPLVMANVAGASELMEDGVSGLRVDRENPAALAEALGRLLRNAELRSELGKRARQRVLDRFTWDRALDDYQALYGRMAQDMAAPTKASGTVGREG